MLRAQSLPSCDGCRPKATHPGHEAARVLERHREGRRRRVQVARLRPRRAAADWRQVRAGAAAERGVERGKALLPKSVRSCCSTLRRRARSSSRSWAAARDPHDDMVDAMARRARRRTGRRWGAADVGEAGRAAQHGRDAPTAGRHGFPPVVPRQGRDTQRLPLSYASEGTGDRRVRNERLRGRAVGSQSEYPFGFEARLIPWRSGRRAVLDAGAFARQGAFRASTRPCRHIARGRGGDPCSTSVDVSGDRLARTTTVAVDGYCSEIDPMHDSSMTCRFERHQPLLGARAAQPRSVATRSSTSEREA